MGCQDRNRVKTCVGSGLVGGFKAERRVWLVERRGQSEWGANGVWWMRRLVARDGAWGGEARGELWWAIFEPGWRGLRGGCGGGSRGGAREWW